MSLTLKILLISIGFACFAPPVVLYVATRGPQRALRRLGEVHWTELARVRWGFLMAVNKCTFFLCAGAVAVALVLGHDDFAYPRLLALATLGLAYVTSLAVTVRLARDVPGPRNKDATFGQKLKTSAAWIMLLRGPAVASLVALAIIPMDARSPWAYITVLALLVVVVWLLGPGATWAPRKLGVMAPASQELAERVNSAGERAGLGPIPAYILEMPIANAFALLFGRAIGITRGLIGTLTDEQLDSVLDHEAAHLAEGRARRWAHGAAAFVPVPILTALPVGMTFGPIYGLALGSLSILILVAGKKVAISLETRADAAAHKVEVNEGEYAGALESLHGTNLTPAVVPAGSSPHGNLYDRMVEAGVQPNYPRPGLPDPQGGLSVLLLAAYIALIGACSTLSAQMTPASKNAIPMADE